MLAKEKEKAEVQEGLIKAIDVLDAVIETINGWIKEGSFLGFDLATVKTVQNCITTMFVPIITSGLRRL